MLAPALLTALLTLAACNPFSKSSDQQQPATPAAPGEGGAVTVLTPEQAQPEAPKGPDVRVRPVGPQGVAPAKIVIHTRDDLLPQSLVGQPAPDGTAYTTAPHVDGTLTVTARDELTFVPAQPFAPDTAYTFALAHLSTGTETFNADSGNWTAAFKTPAFGLAGIQLRNQDIKNGKADVDLVFSNVVDAAEVAKHVTFSVGDAAVSPARVSQGADPWLVSVSFVGPKFLAEGRLFVALSEGVHMAGAPSVTAPRATANVELHPGKPIDILAASVREGTNGFYVDIVCRDQSVPTTRYWWDDVAHEDYEVSSRCLLTDDEVRSSVHLTPSLDVSTASSPGGFRLFAPFERGTYHLVIDAGATSIDGGVVVKAYDADLKIPARSAEVAFVGKGRYLPRDQWKNLAITHRNVDLVDLTVRHVPEENLVFWMTGSEPLDERTSDVVLHKTLRLTGENDVETTSWLDLQSLMPDVGKGVYELSLKAKVKKPEPASDTDAASADQEAEEEDTASPRSSSYQEEIDDETGKWLVVAHTSSRLLLTDMHVIAKMSATGPKDSYTPKVMVWTLGVEDNRPVSGADVSLVKPSGKVMASCRTDAAGGCTMDVPQDAVDKTAPVALIARHGDDLTYVKFSDLQIEQQGDVWGEPYLVTYPYRAAVWSDRGVYRPGETAHVAAIVRNGDDNVAPQSGLPVVAKLYDPTNKELRKKVESTNAAGLVTVDLSFGDYATTGRYRVDLVAGDNTIGSTSFNVEEFVPERMRVTAKTTADGFLADQPVPFDVEAEWLFGGSAEGSRVEVQCQLAPMTFVPAKHQDYHYGLDPFAEDDERRTINLDTVSGALGADGKAEISCPQAAHGGGFVGEGTMVANVAVFEGDSGRTTSASVSSPVHPDKFYIGLNAGPQNEVEEGKPTTVKGLLVDWNGDVAAKSASDVEIEVVRMEQEYGWVWDQDQQTTVFRRLNRRFREEDRQVKVAADGTFSFDFTPVDAYQDYLVVAKAGNARTELRLQGTGWYWRWSSWYGDSYDTTPRPERPAEMAVKAPEEADVGAPVKVQANAPYDGKMLFTVETSDVLFYQWKDVKQGPVDWEFTLRDFAPNVYVTAFLVKDPHQESAQAFLPGRAYGVTSVRVQPTEYTHPLKLTTPAEMRPNSPLTVGIDVGPTDGPTWVTVAAVDEGILSLTKYTPPNPFTRIFDKRALGVSSYETIGWTLVTPPGAPSATGGDEDAGNARVSMVKPVALWSGAVEVPSSGKTQVTFDVPSYRGALRVMAVSAGQKKMGHADAEVKVRDPLTLETTMPRFLVDDDTAHVPVMLTNTSAKPQSITVKMTAEEIGGTVKGVVVDAAGQKPFVSFPDGDTRKLDLKPGATGTVEFSVAATRAPGAVHFKITATSADESSFEELDLPIEPAQPEAKIAKRYALEDGVTDLKPHLDGWMPGGDRETLWVTVNPYGQSLSHLGYLVHYPYGCIEQTTSSTRPLLFVGDLMDQIDPKILEGKPIDDMVMSGIDRVLSMQTPSGGFAYWPGGTEPVPWGTAYATHMLLDAKKKNYAVPQIAVDEAVNYLGREVDKFPADTKPSRDVAYEHYVLALAGKGRPAQIAKLIGQLGTDDQTQRSEERYLLMAALWLSGDRRYEAQLKHPPTDAIVVERPNDWSFYSDLRGRGMMLSTFYDLFGRDPAGQALADLVADNLSQQPSYWYTTQELVWGVTGLGKWSTGTGKTAIGKAELLVDGKPVKATSDKGGGFTWTIARGTAAKSLQLDVKRSGSLPVYLIETVEGTREHDDLAFGSAGFSISRSFLDDDGKDADLSNLKLGQTLYVVDTVTNTSGRFQQNVAFVDRLPAAFEIENSRLGRGGLTPDFVDADSQWSLDHMDLRDDRVEAFGSIDNRGAVQVVYQVRVVTSGRFTEPEAHAEAMYDPRYWGRVKGDAIVVHGPWDR